MICGRGRRQCPNLVTGKKEIIAERPSDKWISINNDGKYIAYSVLHFGLFTTPNYGTLYVYNIQTGCVEGTMKLNNEGQAGYFDFGE